MRKKTWKVLGAIILMMGFIHAGTKVKGQEEYWKIQSGIVQNPLYFQNGTSINIQLKEGIDPNKMKLFINRKQQEAVWNNHKTELYFEEEGVYHLSVEHEDGKREDRTIIIELHNPTVPEISYGTYRAGRWSAENVKLQAWGAEAVSGIMKYEYKIGEKGWKEMPHGEVEMKKSMEDTIRIRAVSKAGRTGDIKEIPVKIWKKKPSNAQLAYDAPEKSGWYKKIPQIQVSYPKVEGPEITTYITIYDLEKGTSVTKKNQFPSISEDGKYLVETWTVDEAGNQSEKSKKHIFYIDSAVPEIFLKSKEAFQGKQKTIRNQKVSIYVKDKNITLKGISIYTSGTQQGKWKKEGDMYMTEVSFSKEGKQYLEVMCEDRAGNREKQELDEFIIDRTAPKIVVEGLSHQKVYFQKVYPQILITDKSLNSSKTKVLLNHKKWDEKPIEKDGHYILKITAWDDAGNSASQNYAFTVNQQGIKIRFLQEEMIGKAVNQKNLKLAFYVENIDPVQVRRFRVNGMEVPYVWNKNVVSMEQPLRGDGVYKVDFEIMDAGGQRKGRKDIWMKYDTKAPVISVYGVKNHGKIPYGEELEIILENKKDQFLEIQLDGEKISCAKSALKIQKLEPGTHEIYMKANDKAGNISEKKIKFQVEKVWPKISQKKVKKQLKEKRNWGVYIFCGSIIIGVVFILNIKKKASRL